MFGFDHTPFDVRLVAFQIPTRVHPSFWIAGALLGWNPDHVDHVFIWVMCIFVSVLVHELGHGLIAEAFGWPSEILLYWGGGLTFSERRFNRTPWREIAVSLAGPFAGFGLFGLTLGTRLLLPHHLNPYVELIFFNLIVVNLIWGLINLLPVLPLDGGQVCQSFLTLCRLRDPVRAATQVSVAVSALAAAGFFMVLHQNFTGMLFAMLCIQNIMALKGAR